jgi:isoleucyl-tRNA synthetase
LIAMSTVLENEAPMKTILGYATMLAEDGRAMHKSWGNSIEFNEGAEKIGVDVMRWIFARQNPSDNMLFGYNMANEVRRQFHLKLWNVYNFFVTYANIDGWEPGENPDYQPKNVLDVWIVARLADLTDETTKCLDSYDPKTVAEKTEEFVDDLSNWYVRRSRDRVGASALNNGDREDFYLTLFVVLVNLSRLTAPIMPFMSDVIFTNLSKTESVHLVDWPTYKNIWPWGKEYDELKKSLVTYMPIVRNIVELGHSARKESNIPVRQPLASLTVHTSHDVAVLKSLEILIKEELNVKEVIWKETKVNEVSVKLDTQITPELKAEGDMRQLVRQIQEERKKLGTALDDMVDVTLPEWPKNFEEEIKKRALVNSLSKGEFSVKKSS